jgi:hypothetical protein
MWFPSLFQRPAARLRRSTDQVRSPRPSCPPRLEPLEDRTVPSPLVINDVANATPTTWLITANKVTQIVQGSVSGPTIFDTTPFTGLIINAGTGGNIFNVQSTTAAIPLTINSQAADTVNLGNTTDGVQDVLGDVTLNNPNHMTAVSLDDTADVVGRSVNITSAAITGLAPANIFFPHNPGRLTTILAGSGGNQFNVQSTAAGTTTNLVTQLAANTATVGQNGSVQGILGSLNLDPSGPQWSAVMLDDSADPALRTVTITGTSITGLSPGAITYAGVQNLTVEGSSGGNQFNVQSTAAGTATTLVTQLAANTATVGQNGSVQGILGSLNLDPNGPSWSAVMLDDSADPALRTVTITGTSITGLAPGVITYAGVQNLTVDGSSGGNRFIMPQGPPNFPQGPPNFTIQSGGLADSLTIDDQADTLASLWTVTGSSISLTQASTLRSPINYRNLGSVEIDGGSGGNKFTFPQGPPQLPGGMTIQGGSGINTLNGPDSANTWQITGANAGALDGVVAFTSIQNLIGGSGNDVFAFNTGGSLAGTLDGGGGTNTLDYSAYLGDVTVNLQLGAATGVAGGISNIANVTGSQGNDLIVGDDHANVLVGGTGRNILIGGGGPDLPRVGWETITGGGGDNILIGGGTAWDTNPAALAAIMHEWTDTSLTFKQRVHALRKGIVVNGQTYALNRSTVMKDTSPDNLNGGSGRNWFFVDHDDVINNGAGPGPDDRVTKL